MSGTSIIAQIFVSLTIREQTNINGAGQSVHILHAHSSFLSSLPRCYYKHDFSVNHIRTTYRHNNLSAQCDQSIAVFC